MGVLLLLQQLLLFGRPPGEMVALLLPGHRTGSSQWLLPSLSSCQEGHCQSYERRIEPVTMPAPLTEVTD